MRVRIRYVVLVAFLCLLGWAGKFLHDLDAAWRAPGPLVEEKLVYIQPGSGTNAIAARLAAEGVIGERLYFRLLARLGKVNGELKAGEYLFPARASVGDVIRLLQSGRTHQRKFTVAEGLMSVEAAAIINAAEAMEGLAEPPEEGSILPETYSYTRGDDRAEVVARMKRAMEKALDELWEGRDPSVPLATKEEAVILASIVEKETGVAEERARVAGVFYNRLRKGIPLQSDPTVIYGITLGKYRLDRPLSRKDLGTPTPYNTYLVSGLTPTPIANPGRKSLEAVMHPESHGYFYFVADGTGGHAFAETLEGHNRNVAKWRAIEKEARKVRPKAPASSP